MLQRCSATHQCSLTRGVQTMLATTGLLSEYGLCFLCDFAHSVPPEATEHQKIQTILHNLVVANFVWRCFSRLSKNESELLTERMHNTLASNSTYSISALYLIHNICVYIYSKYYRIFNADFPKKLYNREKHIRIGAESGADPLERRPDSQATSI